MGPPLSEVGSRARSIGRGATSVGAGRDPEDPGFHIVDDPRRDGPRVPGSFDGEGRAVVKRFLVRDGQLEATNYFYSLGDGENVLELTFNHDERTYDLGDAYGHIAIGVDDLDGTLGRLKEQGIEPEREPYRVREGGSRITFVRDPDGYRIELIDRSGK